MREHETQQSEPQQPRRAFGTLTVLAGMLAAGVLGVGSWLQVSGDRAGENHATLTPATPSRRPNAPEPGRGQSDRPSVSAAPEKPPASSASTATSGRNTAARSGAAADSSPAASSKDNSSSISAAQEAAWRLGILGKWKQYSHGDRLLTVNADGTATIDVTLDFASALLFGEKLHFDIEWTLKNDQLVFRTIGGTPEGGVNAVLKIYGNSRTYTVREINDTKMLLSEADEQKTDWDRALE